MYFFSPFWYLEICQKYFNQDRHAQFFFLESRDTGLSANVYLNEMVIKLSVLLGCKGKNEKKTHFKVLLVTNGQK